MTAEESKLTIEDLKCQEEFPPDSIFSKEGYLLETWETKTSPPLIPILMLDTCIMEAFADTPFFQTCVNDHPTPDIIEYTIYGQLMLSLNELTDLVNEIYVAEDNIVANLEAVFEDWLQPTPGEKHLLVTHLESANILDVTDLIRLSMVATKLSDALMRVYMYKFQK